MTYSALMYLTVVSNLGITTCSNALTRRFVILITSSRMMNAVCRSVTLVSTAIRRRRIKSQD